MPDVTPSAENDQSLIVGVNHTQSPGADTDVTTESRRISTRAPRCTNNAFNNTPKEFEGATLKICSILALRNENVTKKVNYDAFCEKL